jgi:hypothetical protein
VAITVALAAPVLVGMAGLGVETGYWYYMQERAQLAADVAAYAGAIVQRDGGEDAAIVTAAVAEASFHGFSATNAVLTVTPRPAGVAPWAPRAVQVEVAYTAQRFFSSIYSTTPLDRAARGVAAFEEPTDACVLALDIDADAALDFSGSADINLLGCEVMSNSIAPDAVALGGSADVTTDCINAVGGIDLSGGSLTLTDCAAVREGLSRAPDPYADRLLPDYAAEPCESFPKGANKTVTTVSPGADGIAVFCGGMSLNKDFHFEPGVYVVSGGTLRANGSSLITGDDVTFHIADGATVSLNGTTELRLSAPDTGNYAGILFMGERSGLSDTHIFNGTADSLMTGALYFPNDDLRFNGNFSGQNGCMQLVAATVDFRGAAHIETDCSGTGIAWAKVPGSVRLVE